MSLPSAARLPTGVGYLCAAVIGCLPVVALAGLVPRPIALSAWLGTTAIAIHRPDRYRSDARRIAAAYGLGFLLMILVAVAAVALGSPGWFTTTAGLVLLVASPAARWHPPVACLPLAVTATTPVATVADWALLGLLTVGHLLLLGGLAATICRGRCRETLPKGDPK